MKLLSKFAAAIDALAVRIISSHLMTFFHLVFITLWLLSNFDLTVLALLLSFEGVFIWTVVLKSTERIRRGQDNKARFENKRVRDFLESDVKTTEQSLKINREIFVKLQDVYSRLEELDRKVESLAEK